MSNLPKPTAANPCFTQLTHYIRRKTTNLSSTKNFFYLVYPGLKAYSPPPTTGPAPKPEDYKLTRTELGKETIDGQACTKQKVIVRDDKGEEHEATLWLATDLKDFPIRIDFAEGRHQGKLRFQNVKFEEPPAAQFQPPADFTKYNSMQEMMTTIMLKRFGTPPSQP